MEVMFVNYYWTDITFSTGDLYRDTRDNQTSLNTPSV